MFCAAVAGRLVLKFPPGRILITATALVSLDTLMLIPARSTVAIGAVWGLVAVFGADDPVAWFTLRQQIVPQEPLGQVVAGTRMLAFASPMQRTDPVRRRDAPAHVRRGRPSDRRGCP